MNSTMVVDCSFLLKCIIIVVVVVVVVVCKFIFHDNIRTWKYSSL